MGFVNGVKFFLLMILASFPRYGYTHEKTDKEKEAIKGRVDSVVCMNYYSNRTNNWSKTYSKDYEYTKTRYDTFGNEVYCSYHRTSGGIVRQSVYKYDSNGNKTESKILWPDGRLISRTTYTYDYRNCRREIDFYDSRDSLVLTRNMDTLFFINKTVSEYDSTGKLNSEDGYNETGFKISERGIGWPGDWASYTYDSCNRIRCIYNDGEFGGRRCFLYDKAGHVAEIDYYDRENEIYKKESNEYDALGRISSKQEPKKDGGPWEKTTWQYNARGHVSIVRHYLWYEGYQMHDIRAGANGKPVRVNDSTTNDGYILDKLTLYNEDDEIIAEDYYNFNQAGKLTATLVCNYDCSGNLLRKSFFDDNCDLTDDVIYRYFDFDSHGNWLTRVSWEDEHGISTVKREIRYDK